MIKHDNDNYDSDNNYTIMITIKITLIIKIMVNVAGAGLLYQPRSYGPTFFVSPCPSKTFLTQPDVKFFLGGSVSFASFGLRQVVPNTGCHHNLHWDHFSLLFPSAQVGAYRQHSNSPATITKPYEAVEKWRPSETVRNEKVGGS